MYPVRKSAKSKLLVILTFVLFFCVNVLLVCGSEEATTLPSDAEAETQTELPPTETPGEKLSAEKRSDDNIDALAHRILGEDINISLELPNSHRIVIEGRETTEPTIKAEESKPAYTVWKYKPKNSLEHVSTSSSGSSTKYKLKDTFEISKYQSDLKASASSAKDVGTGSGSDGSYPDDFFGPNPVQNGVGKKTEKKASREILTPATDRAYGKFGNIWNKRPIIPLITKHTTIVSPEPHHHHHHSHGWGWRPRKRPHKPRGRYRHYGRPKRYRHGRRFRPHRHHRHHRHHHHDHGWHGHGHGHEHGHSHGHSHEHDHGWKPNDDHHVMPSYAPAYISYGPFYKLPPGVKLENPAYVAPASPAPTPSSSHSQFRSHSKYPPSGGLNHMDTPHIIDKPSHGPQREPYRSHGHGHRHHLKHYHSLEHFDDHGHNSLEYAPTNYEEHRPHYDDHFAHSHSHDKPKHIPYRHHSYGRGLEHDRPRHHHHHHHDHPPHHHKEHLPHHHHSPTHPPPHRPPHHHVDHHHPPHPHAHHHSNELYSHETPYETMPDSHNFLSDSAPLDFYNRDNRPHNGKENRPVDSPNLPGYGTPDAVKNYQPPMDFGHPMHNFGPPMSSFGQPSPTFGPPHDAVGHGHLPPLRDSYLPQKDAAEGKPGPIFGQNPGNNLISGPSNDFIGGQPNFFDKPFKHVISSSNNFNDKQNRPNGFPKNQGPPNFKGKNNFHFNPYPNSDPAPGFTTLPPLIAFEDNMNSFSHKSPNGPQSAGGFRPSKPIDPFPPRPRNGRPPPKFNIKYNSPGMSKDPKITDWFHFAKRHRHEKILLGYPLEEKRKSSKFSTLPEPFKTFNPDPIHRKLPKLTYDNMNKRISMPRSNRRRPAGKRPRHRDLLTKETQDVPLTTDDDNNISNTKGEQEESNSKTFDSPDSQSEDVPLTLKSEQGFQDMIQAHKKLIDS